MKILYIDVNCKYGSTGQIAYTLFSNCLKNNHQSAICYGRGPLIKGEHIFKFGIDIETYLHALLTRFTGYMGKYSFFSTRKLINYINKFKPDVVHIHELHSYFVNIKTLLNYLKKNNIKTVFTNHCEFLYTGKCGHTKTCNKYTTTCGNCPLKKEYPKSILFDKTKQMYLEKKAIFEGWKNIILVTPSIWLKKKMELSFFSNRNIHVINNGIDTNIYSYNKSKEVLKKFSIPLNKKIVISVAPNIFSDNKGGYRFIKLANLMKDNDDILFVAVGAIDMPNDVPNNMKILPLIKDKNTLMSLYSCADCMVICSDYENYPTTSLEAQCCGTKVVGFDVGGVKETILDNHGYVVEYLDLESMKNKINNIVSSPYDKNEVSEVAKKYFSMEEMYNKYFELYMKL